jgi:ubiquinone/menaquinone biosynthesis C-methylase UbiE
MKNCRVFSLSSPTKRQDKYVEVVKKVTNSLPSEILDSSSTLIMFNDDPKLASDVLSLINERVEKGRLLDLGCGYGYLAMLLRDTLGFREVHAIDISKERLSTAKKLGLTTHCLDLEKDGLPFPSEFFDLVIMAGFLNHLKFWDNALTEAHRVLKPKSLILISNPNLGSWIDRASLLLGYQPQCAEVSKIYSVGLPPHHPRKKSIEYVHSTTLKALKELLRVYGFEVLRIWPVRIPRKDLERKGCKRWLRTVIRLIDEVLHRFPELTIRHILVAEKRG